MKLRWIGLVLLVFLLICGNSVESYIAPISDVYTQGIYQFEQNGVYNANVKLIKGSEKIDGSETTLLVLEPNQNVVLYIKLSLNEELKLKEISKGYTMCIIGDGEVAIRYEKVS